MLTMHSKLEQKTYYPTVKDKIDDPSMIDEGLEEHAMVDKAIHDLSRMKAGNEAFDGHFKAMREAVREQVKPTPATAPAMTRPAIDLSGYDRLMGGQHG